MRPEIKSWWKQAEADLDTAKILLKEKRLDAASFYCQQAVEKALKALYILKYKELIKVHDLVLIARKLNAPEEIVKKCALINPAYTAARYPDVVKSYTKEKCEKFLNDSKEVLEWVRKRLNL